MVGDYRQRFGNQEPTGVKFQQVFNETYYLAWVKEQKIYEFIKLVQGTKTSGPICGRVYSLDQIDPELVSIEAKKVVKFQRGLRAAFLHAFGGVQSVAYATIVQ